MRCATAVLLALLALAPRGGAAGVGRNRPGECPTIWRIYPTEAEVNIEAGEYVVFQVGASDGDCDLRWFDWGDGFWLDPVSGCEAESSHGVTVPDIPATYILTVAVVDWQGNGDLTQWEISVFTPVESSSWGRVKALFR